MTWNKTGEVRVKLAIILCKGVIVEGADAVNTGWRVRSNHWLTKASWHSYRCLPIRSLASIRSHGKATMDGTWCFILGMVAGFIPSFGALAVVVLRAG